MSSSRLTGKVLLPVAGFPLVVLCALRIMRDGLDLVLATSEAESDDVLVDEAARFEIKTFRGSLNDVLGRFIGAIEDLQNNDIIVRVTADNPVVDAEFVRSLINLLDEQKIDYLGTSSPLDALPYGLSAEIMTVGALRQANLNAASDFEREHVTPWIRENMRANIVDGHKLTGQQNLSHLRITIDNFDDYLHLNKLFKSVGGEPVDVPWKKLIDDTQNMPSVAKFNVPYRINRGAIESIITLGTAQLGLKYGIANKSGMPESKETMTLIHSAIEHGVNWVDTARAYGLSEQRVGEALSGGWLSRTRVVTKLDPLSDLPDDASVLCIENLVHKSLLTSQNSLGMKHLDVVLLHRWMHHDSHQGQIWEILNQQKTLGLIKELGASIYKPAEAIEALSDKDVTHLQIPFNLLDHRWQDTEFQNALSNRPDVRIHARSVFLQGLLISDPDIWPEWDDNAADRVNLIDQLVGEFGRKNRADLCMAFVLSHDWVDSIVIGVETSQQLQDNMMTACESPLTSKERKKVIASLSDVPDRLLDPSQW